MQLVIVESPSKAKTIEKYLGEGFTVRASVGHIRDLPKSNKNAIDIEAGFVPQYQIVHGKERVIAELSEFAEKAKSVILATDPDREGEAIAWHLAELLKLKKPQRIVFHEITENAVQEALAHPRTIDQKLRQAQEARRVLDRLFGYDLSGLVWQKVRYGLSAGRVQSPALRIIMEREREIRAFVPENFWVISADLKTENGKTMTATCVEEPSTEKEAERILAAARTSKNWHVGAVEEKAQKRAPRAPFTTSTLQQVASTRLGFSPSRTMRTAQKLYEAGYITYMRTDSTTLSKDALSAIAHVVKEEFGERYVATQQYKTKSKVAQEAHEAIRPAHMHKRSAGTTDDQKKLYALIRARTLASQMTDAEVMRTTIMATIGGDIPAFAARGARIMFDGWLAADTAARGEEFELPKVSEGDKLSLIEARGEGKQTQPPPRYTEAGLVKELEKRGIGRPSTYASIVTTLQTRGYVDREGKTLKPTYTGDVVSSFIEEHFGPYISDSFTAEMENELDEIANGDRDYAKTLGAFYAPFTKAIKSKKKIAKITNMGDAPAEFPCPTCNGPMVYKLSKGGRFMSCAKFPECIGARKEDGGIMEPPKGLGEPCPKCGKGELMEREGRFGRFIACSLYPKCKFVKSDETQGKTGVMCPDCAKAGRANGEMMERRGRFGLFYSCSNYPDCKLAIKAKPTGSMCKECGSLMMEGTKTIPERCSSKACPMHNPHKLEKK
ncbi:MAG: type I DNA topoisomerase [Parcubacteria group bacterium]|nr:type I DNA topoisomerase [Parcubacteria group bacterium]